MGGGGGAVQKQMTWLLFVCLVGCQFKSKGDFEISVTVAEDYNNTNEDGRISPGEWVELQVVIENNTHESLDDAELQVIPGGDWTFDLASGEEAASASEAVVTESVSIYANGDVTVTPSFGVSYFELDGGTATIPLELRLRKGGKTKATKKVNVKVQESAASVRLGGYTVESDTNDDALVNPGETVQLYLELENTGSADTQSVEWTISLVRGPGELAGGVTGSDYEMEAGGTARQTVHLTIAPDAEVGDNIVLEAWILEETGRVWTDTLKIPIQASNGRMVIQGYELTEGDGIPTAGDSEYIELQVENTGTSSVPNVTGYLSAGSTYVEVTTSEASDYEVEPGETWTPRFRFSMSEDMPSGHEMPFYLTMEDGLGNIYTDSFTVTEGSGGISLSIDSVDIRQVSGDGDGRVEPGESFYVDLSVANAGGVRANSVTASLSLSDAHIDLSDSSESMGVIQPGESTEVAGAFRFLVLASHPGGWVDFQVELRSGSMSFADSFRVQVR
jgi:uncharacterized membrane protein